ncbi:MAG: hypothetical protein ACHQFW_11560, partial [Chitinophagales bacterium]
MNKSLLTALFLIAISVAFSQSDDPCGAPALTVGTSCTLQSGSNTGFSSSAGIPAPGCGSYTNRDAWYTLTVPVSGTLTIETAAGTISDGAMALYSGTCASLALLECDDDDGAGLMPILNMTGLTPGATLWLRVWKYGGGAGNFSICAYEYTTPVTPVNDDPCGATTLPINTSCVLTADDNLEATNTAGVSNPSCASYNGSDVWYTVTATISGTLTLETTAGSITDGGMAVYSGPDCSTLTEIACDDDSGPGLMPLISTLVSAGSTYWIRVWEFGGDVEGSFNICAWQDTTISNQDCITATQICTTALFDDNSNSDGDVNDLNATNKGCLTTGEHQSAWYYFQIETGGTMSFSIAPDVGSDDFDFGIWGPGSSCPPTSPPTRCSYSALNGTTGLNFAAADLSEDALGNKWVKYMDVVAGEIYILCVDNFSASNNGFEFSFGGTATINCEPIVLPVELISFTAVVSANINILSWATANEINNQWFNVQRSNTGQSFSQIGNIAGAGNSSTENNYSFIDENPFSGINYYRLQMVASDGSYEYSNIISITNNNAFGFTVYPNPT